MRQGSVLDYRTLISSGLFPGFIIMRAFNKNPTLLFQHTVNTLFKGPEIKIKCRSWVYTKEMETQKRRQLTVLVSLACSY